VGGQSDNLHDDDHACRASGGSADRERAISELVGRQHGVVTRSQLRGLGFTADEIDNRLKTSRLHPLHRSVYLAGHMAALPHARELAAVLACGPAAVLSHRNAAHVWSLLPYPAQFPEVEVTVAGRNPGVKPGIRIHRVITLDPRDVTKRWRIPITTPERTLLDLAASAKSRELEQALAEAYAMRIVTSGRLEETLVRSARRPGAAALRELLAKDADPALTRSQAEQRLLEVVRKARLPQPAVNARVGRHEVDLLWRAGRLVVEVDGFRFHSSRTAFERDRARDAELQASGLRVIRVTWRQIVHEPEAIVARIAATLANSRET
jgi:very-short-patch-repair endonuclease